MNTEVQHSNPDCNELRRTIATTTLHIIPVRGFSEDLKGEESQRMLAEQNRGRAVLKVAYEGRPEGCVMQELLSTEVFDCGRCGFRAEII